MINPDEDMPRPTRKLLVPPPLDNLGVNELKGYIEALELEILRVRAAISSKEAHKSAASAFFKARP